MAEHAAPLATIAIPTFNRAKLLPRAVASALAQDYRSIEILVVDNASTDETEDVCRALTTQHPQVRYMRQPFNTGPVHNFETALRNAEGFYFMWLADDDWITTNYLRCCIEKLEQEHHAIVAGQDWWYLGNDIELKPILTEVEYRHPGHGIVPAPILTAHEPEPQSRVLAYLRSVDSNAAIYGVCRTDTARACLPIPTCIAWDWLWVLLLLNMGTLGAASDAGLYRNAEGISADLRHAAAQLGHGPIGKRIPWVLIPLEVFITCNQSHHFPMITSKLDRWTFAIKAALVTCIHLPALRQNPDAAH